MNPLLRKELRLSSLLLTYLFLGFAFLTLLPGYPILCSVFFMTLGIYHSFQNAREAGDILFCTLLPVAKRDVVRAKYQFTMLIELGGFALMALLTLLRMTVLAESAVYRRNALMNANPFCLGVALLLFGLFNLIFVGGFFRTAYQLGRPFVTYVVIAFFVIGVAEALHHVPGLEGLNAFGFERMLFQSALLLCGALLYLALTAFSFVRACRDFERIDL